MDAQFWHERWDDNRIGFHQEDVNKRLKRYWPSLELEPGASVFVPLCGKSRDMLWLHEQGHPVMGIELSAKAVEAFFTENQLPFDTRDSEGFVIYSGTGKAAGIELWAGDFFSLTAQHLSQFTGFYDRASMIAMPPSMREDYAQHLAKVLGSGARGLLLTISYDQERMKGPPFSIPDPDLRQLVSRDFHISELAHYSGPERVGNLAERGLETLDEWVYLLKRN